MKPQKVYAGSVEGSLDPVESIEMDLDLSPEGRAHLLSLMTDLYSDSELAVIREYSTNARDSHIMSGNGHRPIEITLPSTFHPHLVIRDYGLGLSIDELRNVYSKYGASNKRGSDAVNGMLGLGGKSALTYTSQFSITSVKNGVKAQTVVTRNEDGIGVMEVIDTVGTTEPNGVEIKIPTKPRNDFANKAADFFYYWSAGTVLIDGEQPKHLLSRQDVSHIGDRAIVVPGSYYDNDVIVMGNVGYTLPDRRLTDAVTDNRNRDTKIVYYVDMGDVTFAPSREALSFTPRTEARLERAVTELRAELEKSVRSELDSVKTYAEAFKAWTRWTKIIGRNNMPTMTYKGHAFTSKVQTDHWILGIEQGRHNWQANTTADRMSEGSHMYLESMLAEQNFVVTGYNNASGPSPTIRKKIKVHLENLGLTDTVRDVYFLDVLPGAPWTDDLVVADIEDIKAITLPKSGTTANGGKRGTIPVLLYEGGGRSYYRSVEKGQWKTVTDLDANEKILYLSPKNIMDNMNNLNRIHAVLPKVQIVALGANRWDKFKRENPTAIYFGTYVAQTFQNDLVAVMSEDEKFYANHDEAYRQVAEIAKDSDDPTFARLARKGIDETRVRVYNEINPKSGSREHRLNHDYPLLDSYSGRKNQKHVVAYINAVVKEGI